MDVVGRMEIDKMSGTHTRGMETIGRYLVPVVFTSMAMRKVKLEDVCGIF